MMKTFVVLLTIAAAALTGCIEDENVSRDSQSLVRDDSTSDEPSRELEPQGVILTSGGRTETIGGLVSELPPGVIEDCSAQATGCAAQCSVEGDGTCESGVNFVTCTSYKACGQHLCTTTETVNCSSN